jgi:hypothetical protein
MKSDGSVAVIAAVRAVGSGGRARGGEGEARSSEDRSSVDSLRRGAAKSAGERCGAANMSADC